MNCNHMSPAKKYKSDFAQSTVTQPQQNDNAQTQFIILFVLSYAKTVPFEVERSTAM